MTLLHPQIVLQGLATGAIYAVAAMAMQFILGSTGRVHLGVGQALVMTALFLGWTLERTGIPLGWIMLGLSVSGALAARIMHPPALWRHVLREQGERAFIVITIGAGIAMEALAQWLWPLPAMASVTTGAPLSLSRASIVWPKGLAIAVSASTALSLYALLHRTRRGKALRAWDRGSAQLETVGVDTYRLARWATSVGLGVASMGGVLLGMTQVVSAQEWIGWSIKSLCVAVIGGGLNPLTALAMGWAMGVGEAWVSQYLGPQWHPALAPVLLPLVLRLRSRRDL